MHKTLDMGYANRPWRVEAWRFLYGVYPCSSTARERSALQLEQRVTYQALKQKWHSLLPEYAKMCTRNVDGEFVFRSSTEGKLFKTSRNPVTDGFRSFNHPHQLIYSYALPTDVGYAQGMNDLLSRFLEVLDSEEEAYWCFCAYMARTSYNFTGDGMLHKIGEYLLLGLLHQLDHELFAHLNEEELGRMTFCHRWLLLSFQREFPHNEAIRLFEILSSHHLELTSLGADVPLM
uniref:Rab-GAP TBC domain-containing protein n=1 Tax=Eptatretus burgeri TaxID=7764 RepID=A0A8C4QNS3_EPTBU